MIPAGDEVAEERARRCFSCWKPLRHTHPLWASRAPNGPNPSTTLNSAEDTGRSAGHTPGREACRTARAPADEDYRTAARLNAAAGNEVTPNAASSESTRSCRPLVAGTSRRSPPKPLALLLPNRIDPKIAGRWVSSKRQGKKLQAAMEKKNYGREGCELNHRTDWLGRSTGVRITYSSPGLLTVG